MTRNIGYPVVLVFAALAAAAIFPQCACAKGASKVKASTLTGKPMMWQDRGELTPKLVYFGVGGMFGDAVKREPVAPIGHASPDTTRNAYSPKVECVDAAGVKWTAKFKGEVHPDVVAPRLAYALGYLVDEGYYLPGGKFVSADVGGKTLPIPPKPSLGRANPFVQDDGTFAESRFKRHSKELKHVADSQGSDIIWDEAKNPGVPQEQLDGLKILDDLFYNWDAQPKNCKVIRVKTDGGVEDWYIMSDWGASFGSYAHKGGTKWNIKDYRGTEPFIKSVGAGSVEFNFVDAIPSQGRNHDHIALASAKWLRPQLAKLTDDEIRAAFDAAFATPERDAAYASGDPARIAQAHAHEADPYVAELEKRINEYLAKIPAGQ